MKILLLTIVLWILPLGSLTQCFDLGSLFIVATVADEESNRDFMQQSPYQLDWDYTEYLIENYQIGGLIFLGKSTQAQLCHAIKHFQGISSHSLLICIDAEWGLAMRCCDMLPYPKASQLGTMDNQEIYNIAHAIGIECKQLGIHINFAPVADVNTNADNPIIGSRSFGSDPHVVAEKACWFARGLHDSGIIACAKHFPGHGGTATDSHRALPIINRTMQQLNETELTPFIHLIADKIPLIMMGHLLVPALDADNPASLSTECIDFLRETLQFSGLIITDGLGMESVHTRYQKPGELELSALRAGNNLLLCPLHLPEAIGLIKEEMACNVVFAQHIMESLQKTENIRTAVQ